MFTEAEKQNFLNSLRAILINRGEIKEKIKDCVYKNTIFGDLVLTLGVYIEINGFPNFNLLSKSFFNEQDSITEIEAWEETEKKAKEDLLILNLHEFVADNMGISKDDPLVQQAIRECPTFIVTNKSMTLGAGNIFFCDFLKKIIKEYKGIERVRIVPSSKHELLIMPEINFIKDYLGESYMKDCITEVNTTCLLNQDILSDKSYYISVEDIKNNRLLDVA